MAVVLYQRAEPRHKDWLPLLSQQIRLRNLNQIVLINPPEKDEASLIYFTLHVSPMSAPFYTSCKVVARKVTFWPEIEVSLCSTRLSASSCIVRVWTAQGQPILSWGVHFKGLHYLGHREELNAPDFVANTLLFATPFGSFTSLNCLLSPPIQPQRFLQIRSYSDAPPRSSYTLKNLVALHHLQRSVLEEHDVGEKLRMEIGMRGYGVGSRDKCRQQPSLLSERLIQRAKIGRQKLRLKEELELVKMKLNCLTEEKGRAEGRVRRLKKDAASIEELSSELVARIHTFRSERVGLRETKAALVIKGQNLGKFRSGVFLRKKQLISEILQIYPLTLVHGSKRYSINGVQLPNAEDYAGDTGGQISVALGYTAHLAAMLAFFLDIPCRYPIRHFGSRSRIIDHITVQIPDKEREFPLYFKGKRDVYCAYAVYLLNKNVAQLRWYCGLSTPDLRATLPNLVELLTSRLVIPGWPPNLGEALEIAQEITEDIDSQVLENEFTLSLDKGMEKILSAGDGDLFTDENPGNNSTALGDIQHGRGQDRFLSGWKKKTYVETDDFDPKWLMDSMNLDFDQGRKLSISNSSPPQRPVFVVSEDSQGSSRRRRMGQVDPPTLALNNVQEGKVVETDRTDMKRNYTPSKEIARLELDIKEFERRKSRGTPSSSVVPYPTESLSSNSKNSLMPSQPSNETWVTDDERNSDNNATDNKLVSSSTVHVQHSEACNPHYHIPPPVVDIIISPPVSSDLSDSIPLTIPVAIPVDTLEPQHKTKTGTKGISSRHEQEVSKSDQLDSEIVGTDADCDNKNKSEEITEDSSLWIRTEALLGAQSFNLVRRRMSTSEST